jgi:hypothetical protein
VRYSPEAFTGDRLDLAEALSDCDSLIHLRYTRPPDGGFWSRT